MFGFGPGILYYFEPVNLYVSGTLTFTKMYISETDTGFSTGDTNLGIGADFKVGKEWWVAPRWGIGVAGMVHFASMKESNGRYHHDRGHVLSAVLGQLRLIDHARRAWV